MIKGVLIAVAVILVLFVPCECTQFETGSVEAAVLSLFCGRQWNSLASSAKGEADHRG